MNANWTTEKGTKIEITGTTGNYNLVINNITYKASFRNINNRNAFEIHMNGKNILIAIPAEIYAAMQAAKVSQVIKSVDEKTAAEIELDGMSYNLRKAENANDYNPETVIKLRDAYLAKLAEYTTKYN